MGTEQETDAAASELPEFPFFEIDDLEAAWGCPRERYVGGRFGYDEGKRIGYRIGRELRDESEAAQALFFSGGRLTDHGFAVKPELDSGQVHRLLRALLSSFAPSHEEKIGTVALAIHRWFDRCEPTQPDEPEQVS